METQITYKNYIIWTELHVDNDAALPYHCSVVVQANYGDADIKRFSCKPSRATEIEAVEAGLFAGKDFVDRGLASPSL